VTSLAVPIMDLATATNVMQILLLSVDVIAVAGTVSLILYIINKMMFATNI
jgi:hypothetical protein